MTVHLGAAAVAARRLALGLVVVLAACARSGLESLDSRGAVIVPPAGAGSSGPAQPSAGGAPAGGVTAGSPGSAGAAPPVERGPEPCELLARTTVVSDADDSFVVAAAVGGDRFGLAWLREGEPWQLLFRTFSLIGTPLADALELARPLTRPEAAVVAQDGAFVTAWGERDADGGTFIRVAAIDDGAITHRTDIEDLAGARDPTIAIGEDGGLVVSWTRIMAEDRNERVAAVSYDGGASFLSRSWWFYAAVERPAHASIVALPDALAHAWVARATQSQRSALMYARTSASGLGIAPSAITLVEHDRYIYDTALAVSAGRVAIATTDSRENIGTVPLYLTLLQPDGTLIAEGIRLTRDHHHEHLYMAAGTRSFVIIAETFVGSEAENHVLLRQFDLDGAPLFEPLRLTRTDMPPGTRLSQEPRLVALGADRYLALWGERAAHQPRTAYDLIAGIVDCAADLRD